MENIKVRNSSKQICYNLMKFNEMKCLVNIVFFLTKPFEMTSMVICAKFVSYFLPRSRGISNNFDKVQISYYKV